jgi:hypothetical protein
VEGKFDREKERETNPRSSERASVHNRRGNTLIRRPHVRIYNINSIFILKCGVGALPCRDAAAAAAERNGRGLDPGGAEAVEEVGLPGY